MTQCHLSSLPLPHIQFSQGSLPILGVHDVLVCLSCLEVLELHPFLVFRRYLSVPVDQADQVHL